MQARQFHGISIVTGCATGQLLHSQTPLSFWGGTDPRTGEIIDRHHDLHGQVIAGRVLAIPAGRGSCTGSVAILELLLNAVNPAALILEHADHILIAGVIVAAKLFDRSIPVVVLDHQSLMDLHKWRFVTVRNAMLHASNRLDQQLANDGLEPITDAQTLLPPLNLTPSDEEMLQGSHGPATAVAMEVLCDFAKAQGANSFINVTQVHIDACIYTGPASLKFAESFLQLGGKCLVPTSMNSISIDKQRWREIGMDTATSIEAEKLADAYVAMGARPTFTCAPYVLDTAPMLGEHIGWGESNAVVYANSVLGAHTQKYPDFIDLCIALTGRAPDYGCHRRDMRKPKLIVEVQTPENIDDAFYPLLGHYIGRISGSQIPYIRGLHRPRILDLKAFSAAFATTSSCSMFHAEAITPEAASMQTDLQGLPLVTVSMEDLAATWSSLNTAQDHSVTLVALGNPHFSLKEFALLAALCEGRRCAAGTQLVVTTNRHIWEQAIKAGFASILKAFGASVITDTCWCMLQAPVIPLGEEHGNVMTNSGKFAHYAPALVRRRVHFGSLAECVNAACTGHRAIIVPLWLRVQD